MHIGYTDASASTLEKNNIMNRLNETLAMISQQSNIQINKTPSTNQSNLSENIETFRVYIIQNGDYLESICEKHNLNYMDNIEKIMTINGITDVNKIYAGQKLYLPIDK